LRLHRLGRSSPATWPRDTGFKVGLHDHSLRHHTVDDESDQESMHIVTTQSKTAICPCSEIAYHRTIVSCIASGGGAVPMSGDFSTGRRNSRFEAVVNAPARINNSATWVETIATNALVLSTILAMVAVLQSFAMRDRRAALPASDSRRFPIAAHALGFVARSTTLLLLVLISLKRFGGQPFANAVMDRFSGWLSCSMLTY
jgi:hypothetical protein